MCLLLVSCWVFVEYSSRYKKNRDQFELTDAITFASRHGLVYSAAAATIATAANTAREVERPQSARRAVADSRLAALGWNTQCLPAMNSHTATLPLAGCWLARLLEQHSRRHSCRCGVSRSQLGARSPVAAPARTLRQCGAGAS